MATGRPPGMAGRIPQLVDGEVDYMICYNGHSIYRVAGAAGPSEWVRINDPTTIPVAEWREAGDTVMKAHPDLRWGVVMEHQPTDHPNSVLVYCDELAAAKSPRVSGVVPRLHRPAFQAKFDRQIWGLIMIDMDLQKPEELLNVCPDIQKVLSSSSSAEVRDWEVSPFGWSTFATISPRKDKSMMLAQLMRDACGKNGRALTRRDFMAFGDGLNDIGMLQWAGFGVAMANAESDVVKNAANYVTVSNEEDGVAVVLERLLAYNCDVCDFSMNSA